ncbi:E3 ubiquitin-protein ligase UBR1 SKDI_07G4370 [Saccharomyces kudriavzevii IFO 1802]|uniref:E3 ubiquitin-protein ligase n=1 Tax=Saccharomyces kudriavzevii (strain ATCC MYA-4449 / AS 2.2408 / CBS 8840 / NBRC 1802 / NCYC 2889) TaxID=226230 RepID=A0AA35JIL1_SACK1|nr:uncharacterized protein SKDI_07G4370 [Saccharomyces kudriavzevii IFO 1802]CAI4062733.1 hypothetical protein SKDI_07G4370 [Saccharomyces kudriavzevii IFO 1802]
MLLTDENLGSLQGHIRRTLRSIHNLPYFKFTRGPTERADMSRALKEFIYRYLYFIISNDGKELPTLFNAHPKQKLTNPELAIFPESLEDAVDVDKITSQGTFPFYKINESKVGDVHKHTGRNCGRKFKIGEPLYRCHECGCDDTCVLCIHCFNPKDHVNHHVCTDICSEFTSGICDCGDEEAWNSPLHCKAEEQENNTSGSPTTENSIKEDVWNDATNIVLVELVLSEVFDYFIDVFNQNIEPLPTIQKDITIKLREMTQQGKMYERAQFLNDLKYENDYMFDGTTTAKTSPSNSPEASPSLAKIDPENYTVIIYNDEYHNYSQATTALRQGVPDNVHIDLLTSRIDGEGRAMLKCSQDLSSVLGGFFAVQTNGLSATLTSWSEYLHQEACKYIILWITHCLNIPNSSFQNTFRNMMGKTLCSEYLNATECRDMTPVVEKYFSNKFDKSDPYRYIDLSILADGNQIPLGHHKILPESSTHSLSTLINDVETPKSRVYSNTRLQHILYFDNRYWKRLRKDIQNVIIPTLASSTLYKPIFCQQVVEIFNHITRSVAYMDREPQLTAIRECVVQLFTCPTNARSIFENQSFLDIVWSIIDIFKEFCKVEGGVLIWQKVQKSNLTKSYSISFKQGLYTVETLLSKVHDPSIPLRPREMISLLTLCKLFNGAWKIKRKEGEHVLHEDQNFISYLEYTTSIYSIIQTAEKVDEKSNGSIESKLYLNAIRIISSFLGNRSLTYKLTSDSHEIIKFSVSHERVAFMNPLQTMLSFLIEKVSLEDAYEALEGCSDFLKISDFSLRSVVLCSQIDVGFWVRNGMSVLHQASYYKNNPELGSYSRDIHLNQLALLWERDDIPRIIYNILDRWELLDWFTGEREYQHTVYEDKISFIIQQFIAFIYQILTERQYFKNFSSSKERRMDQIKNSIIYNLYMKPFSYSKLLRSVPDYLSEDTTEFDEALEEVSVFVEPKGLADNGVFKLKASLYAKVDPLKLLNLENEFESSATIIKTHLAKNKEEIPKVVLIPQVSIKQLDKDAVNLGAFTRNTVFAKVVYKLLQVCLDMEDSTFLNELLHLIHGIFKDDELINGKNSIPEAYLSKPICNLLLSIANAESEVFSESIVRKADYLLEKMIIKKPDELFESLITSFGSQYVNDYKDKKLRQGVNLQETEKERKRRLAKKHQARLLAKFNNQQTKFMKEHESEFDEQDNDVDMVGEKVYESEDFTCALCQDSSSTDFFVIPAYHDQTPIFRPGNILNPKEFMPVWDGFYNDDEKQAFIDDDALEALKENGNYGSRKVFVSCNHHIHHNCFKRYVQKKRFSSNAFICPLCQTFSNCTLPLCQTSKANTGLSLDTFLKSELSLDILSRLFKPFTEEDYRTINSIFSLMISQCQGFDKVVRKQVNFTQKDVSLVLSVHWANTISMLEVSSRLEKPHSISFFRNREQKYKTLKNILVCIMLFTFVIGKPSMEFEPYPQKSGTVWNQNQLFQYVVRNVLFSPVSFRETVTEALTAFCKQFLSDFFKGLPDAERAATLYVEATSIGDVFEVDERTLFALKSISGVRMEGSESQAVIYDLAYTSLLKSLLPTIRRCLVFVKVLHELMKDSENETMIINGLEVEEELEFEDIPGFVNKALEMITEKKSLVDLLKSEHSVVLSHPYLEKIPYEYCGIIKLIDLSKYLNTYVTQSKEIKLREERSQRTKNAGNRLDFKICLTCGVKVHLRADRHEITKHLNKNCFKSFGAFLMPNSSEVCLHLTQPPSNIFISAPYLNSHGEVGRNAMRRGDLTTLNLKRYEHLNRLWINNEIPGYISRVMGDEFRVTILSNGFLFAFNREPRPRRVPPTDGDDEDMEEGEEGGFTEENDDMDLDDETGQAANLFGVDAGGIADGGVRDFFQFFENFRNTLQPQGNGDDNVTQNPPPILQFLGPQFDGATIIRNTNPRNLDEDDSDENDDSDEREIW